MKSILSIAVIVLLAIVFLQRCNGCKQEAAKADTVTTTKTEYVPVHDTVYGKPQIVKVDKVRLDTVYAKDPSIVPSEDRSLLKEQYEFMIAEHYNKYHY